MQDDDGVIGTGAAPVAELRKAKAVEPCRRSLLISSPGEWRDSRGEGEGLVKGKGRSGRGETKEQSRGSEGTAEGKRRNSRGEAKEQSRGREE